MNWVDILVLIVLAVTGYRGYKSGLIRMVVILFVMAVGIAFSSRLSQPIGNLLPSFTDNARIQSIIVFLVLILVLIVAAEIISRALVTVIKFLPFAGLANSLVGTGIGLLVGFVILSAVLTGLQKFPFGNMREDIDDSPLGSFMADNFDVVIRGIRLIPGDWDEKLSQMGDKISNLAEPVNGRPEPWQLPFGELLTDWQRWLPESRS
jgi:uncharacterized membrane protein required for colicin V production